MQPKQVSSSRIGQLLYFYDFFIDCNTANTEQPLICLDLTIISVLLRDGFGLDMTTKLNVRYTL